jgi:hypothetical protein
MRRALALLLAVCCVLSGAAFAAPTTDRIGESSPARPVAPATNTSEYLRITPSALETAAYRRTTLDVSATLALDTRGLTARFKQLTLDERFAATDSMDARRAQLRATAARIEARIEQLRNRQSAAIRAYNNGSLSAREFVVELARIGAAAGRLGTAADRVAARASSVSQSTINGQPAVNWARNRRVELGPLDGPVRERIREALRGENTVRVSEAAPTGLKRLGQTRSEQLKPLGLYVETTRNGVVLATVDDGQYYREAYLPSERNNTTASGLADITDALERVRQRYPWAWNNSGSTDSSSARRAGVYQFILFHEHGQLTTYLDRDSGQVFAEQQRKRLRSIPTTASVTGRTGSLRLTVNRTHPTGPLELSLSTTSGDPVDGRITINGTSIGRIGPDGHRWTVTPRGTFTVTARANGRTVRVEMNATPRSNRTARGAANLPTPPGER